jgi:phytoene/squalene synthetase
MSLAHCIDMVAQGDPDRHAVTRAADDATQARLYPLYALNLEIARAAWASAEPMVCEMRLQWWRDAVEKLTAVNPAPPPHPVLDACGWLAGDAAAGAVLDALIEARRWDVWAEPFADAAALWAHLGATGGAVMGLAARALGADDRAQAIARDFGTAAVLAPWLQAVPELTARGRAPLPDPSPQAIAALARDGLVRLAAARAQRGAVPRAVLPALLPGWQAAPLLRLAARDPARVLQGGLWQSEFARRGGLAWHAVTGLW